MAFSAQSFISRRWRWPTVAVIAGMIFLANLGSWQLDRLEWRRGLNEQTAAELSQPPIRLDLVDLDDYAWEEMQNRQATAVGRYDLANQIIVESQIFNQQSGRYLVTPLLLADQEAAILVLRGWLPNNNEDFAAYNPPEIDEISGYIQQSQVLSGDRVSEITEDGRIFRIDIGIIAETLPYELMPVFITAVPPEVASGEITAIQSGLPFPIQPDLSLSEGSHLSYALQWFTFSLMLGGIYIYYVYRQESATAV